VEQSNRKRSMSRIFTALLGMLLSTVVFAQGGATTITGIVKNTDGKMVEAATVTLQHMPDKKVVKINVTNANGEFEFINIPEGSYQLLLTAVGYQSPVPVAVAVAAGQPTVKAEFAPIAVASKNLGDVTVQGKAKMVETKIDRTVVNVDAMISNAGGTALEVLEKSPGIMVDRDGNISLKGKQGVIVMIDGKPTYMGGLDLANYLRNMPSNQLDQIEIMTQPPAKFDASGNSGVINIKTKKSRQDGFNGSVSLGYIQAVYPKSSNSLNLNWRKNKVNVFANLSFSYWQGFSDVSIYRNFRQNGVISSTFDQKSNQQFISRNSNAKVGVEYFANKNTTVGVTLTGNYNPRDNYSSSRSNILNSQGIIDSVNTASTHDDTKWKNVGANFNVRRVLNKSGREITADADYIWYGSISNQNNTNNIFNAKNELRGNPFQLRGYLPSDIKIYSLKTDYVHPLAKGAKLEAGLKSSLVKTDNEADYKYFNVPTSKWNPDTVRSNHFLYDENINAAYVNYSRQVKKWGVQAGLRVENTNGKGNQLRDKTTFTRHYTQLFPTLYISNAVNDKNTFSVSYSRRINRPNYQDLNPFIYFLDSFTYRQGNPYLLPQFSHNVEVSHAFLGKLITTFNFTTTKDIINDVLKQNDITRVTFQTKENIARQNNFGLSVSYNSSIAKWYQISVYANGFVNQFNGFVNNTKLDVTVPSFMFNVNNQFRFNKGWGAEASGFYRSKTQEAGVIVARGMGVINFAVSKQVMNNKGSIKLALNDPFWIQKFNGYTKFGNIDAVIKNKWDNRRVGLTFSYRFGKVAQQQATRRRAGSAQDEQNRAGGAQTNQ
jgi:hypothetical protein